MNKSGTNRTEEKKEMLLPYIQVLTKAGYVLCSGRNRPLYRNIRNAKRYRILPEINNLLENITETSDQNKFIPWNIVGVTCCLGNYCDITL